MKNWYRIALAAYILVVVNLFVPVAEAHPLGNFTINHYAGLRVGSDAVTIDFVLDMAEIPAFQEITAFDPNSNGQPDPGKAASYHPAKCAALRPDLDLRINGQSLTLALVSSALDFPPGAGGLLTLRLSCAFRAALAPAAAGTRLDFADHSYADRIGWREIVVTGDSVSVVGEFATTSVSRRLTAYPQDMLTNPLNERQVTVTVAPAGGASGRQPPAPGMTWAAPSASPGDRFTQLITLRDFSLPTLLIALLISVVWGAMHAMTPGHGKTLVGAYLVGSRGTARHAVFLGLATTITHTTGVFALGLVTLMASQLIVPEQLFPWLSFISGLLVIAIGLSLFLSRVKAARRFGATPPDHTRPDPAHDHTHPHTHEPDDSHGHGSEHEPAHGGHSHLPPGADGSPVTWRSLLALGISGGLLPCPSALIVLLSAIALGRIAFGLVLVLAFSMGLAGTLTAVGLLLVYTGRLVERLPAQGRWLRLIPAASALFITLAGAGITAQALIQIGLIRL
jgi:nickel/cobalt exporter